MNLYVDSSAVLSWLLEEPPSGSVRRLLREAEVVMASDLTPLECERSLVRAAALGHFPASRFEELVATLHRAAASWTLLTLDSEVLERARRPFPLEPVRTLDALHLASALLARQLVDGLALLSLDDRLRKNARLLGFPILPA